MLKPAINYVDQLSKLRSIIFDNEDKYKYYISNCYVNYDMFKIDDNDWGRIQKVSVNSKDEVQGYFSAKVDFPSNVEQLAFCHFYLDSKKLPITFVRDMLSFVDYLFINRAFEKINFSVIVGNPAERLYDSFIEKFKGRVVGTFVRDVQLLDQKMYDVKWYELLKDDYIKVKNDTKTKSS